MPHSIEYRPADLTAVLRLSGTVDGQEIIGACLELARHPSWERGFSTLWDLRAIGSLLIVPEDLAAFAEVAPELAERRGPGRTAFVTGDPWVEISALLLGLKAGGSGRVCRVFPRLEAAEAWLAEVADDMSQGPPHVKRSEASVGRPRSARTASGPSAG